MMKIKLLVVVACLLCCYSVARSDEDDDTLLFLQSKSALVISGQVTSPITQTLLKPMTYYSFDFKVAEVIKGELPKDKSIHVRINRVERYLIEESTFLKQGNQCILFLKPMEVRGSDKSHWQSADLWFGAQPYNHTMLGRLKKLLKQEDKDK
jgi:hypothetical protein